MIIVQILMNEEGSYFRFFRISLMLALMYYIKNHKCKSSEEYNIIVLVFASSTNIYFFENMI